MLRFIEEYNYSWSWQNKKKLLLGYVNAIKSRIKACKVTFMWQLYSLVGSGTCNSCREQTSIYILQIHTNLVTILNVIEGRKGTTHYSANMIMYLKSWNNPRQISTATKLNWNSLPLIEIYHSARALKLLCIYQLVYDKKTMYPFHRCR